MANPESIAKHGEAKIHCIGPGPSCRKLVAQAILNILETIYQIGISCLFRVLAAALAPTRCLMKRIINTHIVVHTYKASLHKCTCYKQ
jgi:hypothetical protein